MLAEEDKRKEGGGERERSILGMEGQREEGSSVCKAGSGGGRVIEAQDILSCPSALPQLYRSGYPLSLQTPLLGLCTRT